MRSEKQELEKIEEINKTWQSEQLRYLSIWEAIAMQINSTKGEENEFWGRVMDLFKLKNQ